MAAQQPSTTSSCFRFSLSPLPTCFVLFLNCLFQHQKYKRMLNWGLMKVISRVDPEPFTRAVAEKAAERRTQPTSVEATGVRQHQSVGGVGRYQRLLQEQMRVIRTELVDHIHREFDAASPFGHMDSSFGLISIGTFLGEQRHRAYRLSTSSRPSLCRFLGLIWRTGARENSRRHNGTNQALLEVDSKMGCWNLAGQNR